MPAIRRAARCRCCPTPSARQVRSFTLWPIECGVRSGGPGSHQQRTVHSDWFLLKHVERSATCYRCRWHRPCSTTAPPREVLTRIAPGFISASSRADQVARLAVSTTWIDTTSEAQQVVEQDGARHTRMVARRSHPSLASVVRPRARYGRSRSDRCPTSQQVGRVPRAELAFAGCVPQLRVRLRRDHERDSRFGDADDVLLRRAVGHKHAKLVGESTSTGPRRSRADDQAHFGRR